MGLPKQLTRREFLQQVGVLGAGAAITAAQAKVKLAKSLLGMGEAAAPAAAPLLGPSCARAGLKARLPSARLPSARLAIARLASAALVINFDILRTPCCWR